MGHAPMYGRDSTMHAITREAAEGSAAIARFIATRFDLADQYEAQGDRRTADEMRDTWTTVLSGLSVVDRAIAAESFQLAEPVPA